jgi:DNA-binding transcriptional regulator YiaG
MSGFAATLGNEIKRIARKELKSDINAIKAKANTSVHEIAALKRRIKDLESMVMKLTKVQIKTAPEVATKVITARQTRWSAAGFAKLRKRLKLSAREMGKLLGVSMATIYHWEDAESENRPRSVHMPKILAARKLTAARARKVLESLQ